MSIVVSKYDANGWKNNNFLSESVLGLIKAITLKRNFVLTIDGNHNIDKE